jgi:N-acetylmuramoyl-L-alanine amidase
MTLHLVAALCTAFPKIKCDYPRDAEGKLIPRKLDAANLENFAGILGHYHVQTDKTDPGPAFDWDKLIGDARELMGAAGAGTVRDTSLGHMRKRL